ncbi:MAG: glycosyltransferase [Deltaproteobacteria bacterium]|nr:glycosyltransferase [Deltaproteobacteria bacterium]
MNDYLKMEKDQRPWGYYVVLADEPGHKVKRIVVNPGHRLSLQRHKNRSEHWYIVEGTPIVRNGTDEAPVEAGGSIDIPRLSWHRISNPGDGPVVLIEVQRGNYLGEDDIERAEDDYGRLK